MYVGRGVVVVVDTFHHIFCFSDLYLLFASFFLSPHGREQFPKECDSEEREGEGEGWESHPMTAVSALFIRNISLILPNDEFRWKVIGWPGCGWGGGEGILPN